MSMEDVYKIKMMQGPCTQEIYTLFLYITAHLKLRHLSSGSIRYPWGNKCGE